MGWCRSWTSHVDEALTDLLGGRRGVAVVALGGYARRELCPASDIDLVLLHDGWGRHDLEALVEALCYPLWDAGLSVGHAVRTPAEAVADAGAGVDASTAVLDRRLVAGDPGLFDALSARVRRWAARRSTPLLRALADADAARHRSDGAYPGMLEPNLKNGAGGLRDIHSLRWAAGWLLGECALDPLVAAGYLGADDRRRLSRANETLLAVRCALHHRSTFRGKMVDVLRLDQQDEVAALLHGAGADCPDADELLRDVGLAMRLVAHLSTRTWGLVLSDLAQGRRLRRRPPGRELASGVRLEGGVVTIDPAVTLAEDAAVGLRAVAVVAQTGAHLGRATADHLVRQLASEPQLAWSSEARAALLRLLHAGRGVAEGLAEADHVGLLSAHLPQWQRVRGRPQRNPLHRFDLDTHGAQTVVVLHELRHDEELETVWRRLPDADAVVLGAWLHDIGKAWPGDHSIAGAQVAQRWLEDMGFEPQFVAHVVSLIRLHLLLPDVATRRDLDDPAVIAHVARQVGDTATLDGLYLLSLADSRATGPSAWSPWKDGLITTLHQRVSASLRGGDTAPVPDPRVAAASHGATPAMIDALAAQAPARYFTAAAAEQVAVHARLLAAGVLPAVDIRPGPVEGTTVVTVAAPDRPRLLADCAGALAAADLAVVEARAVTTGQDIALDWFTVTGEADHDPLQHLLLQTLRGDLDVAQRLARPRRAPGSAGWAPQGGATITLRSETLVEVEARDRPALLFALCRVLDNAGLEIVSVRAATLGSRVFDAFELRKPPRSDDLDDVRNQLLSAAEGTI